MKNIRTMNTERRRPAAKFLLAALLIAACSLLFLPGCQNPLRPPEMPEAGPGTLSLTIGGVARTIVPVLTVDRFERFAILLEPAYECDAGNTYISIDDWEPGYPIILSAGLWDITVAAYTDEDDGYPAAEGTIYGFEMTPGVVTGESIVLSPIIGGAGRFSWDGVNFPASIVEATMEIFEWYEGGVGDSLDEFDLFATGGDTYISLDAGQYFVLFTLSGEGGDEAELGHILHIYRNIVTELPVGMFANFVFPDPRSVAGQIVFLHALHAADELPTAITILTEVPNEQLPPQALYFDGEEITVTLAGGNVLSLYGGPGAMFTVGPSVTLVLDGVELRGMADNISSLVVVEEGGTLIMEDGSRITGNVYTGGEGGGVFNGGIFDMRAGALISGNAAGWGGGVHNNGTFDMRYGAVIFGNASAPGAGGGVDNDGVFNMHAGAVIRDNTAAGTGGGVVVWGTFNMLGGTITGNTAASNGGGVSVITGTFNMYAGAVISYNMAVGNHGGGVQVVGVAGNQGVFNMHGGLIHDNSANWDGGGVVNAANGVFNMHDGAVIRDNTADWGGGVLNTGIGAFTMHGGTISYNTAARGGGVDNAGIFEMHPGAVISGNNAIGGEWTAAAGGGVNSPGGGTFRMLGGEIFDNTSAGVGGGVANSGAGNFTMHGGAIFDNTASTTGGGVNNIGVFIIDTGAVYGIDAAANLGNTATTNGAALFTGTGGQTGFGPLNPDGTFGANILLFPAGAINYTIQVAGGNVSAPAVGIIIPGIPAEYVNGAVVFRTYRDGDFQSQSAFIVGGATAYLPLLDLPGAETGVTWDFQLAFHYLLPGNTLGALRDVYRTETPVSLVGGQTTIPFATYFDLVIDPPVTSITITGIPAVYHDDDLVLYAGGTMVGHMYWVRAANVTIPVINMMPGNHSLEMVFEIFPDFDVRSRYALEAVLVAGINTIPFADFTQTYGTPPPGPITSVTVTGVGDYIGLEMELYVFVGGVTNPWPFVNYAEVTGDSVTVTVPAIGWYAGDWQILLQFVTPVGWNVVAAYEATKTFVTGANAFALGDFDDITPTGAAANLAPFGGAFERRTLPTERPMLRLDGRTQRTERLMPRLDGRTQPAEELLPTRRPEFIEGLIPADVYEPVRRTPEPVQMRR